MDVTIYVHTIDKFIELMICNHWPGFPLSHKSDNYSRFMRFEQIKWFFFGNIFVSELHS